MKKNKTKKQMCTAGIIALILVAIDQLTKYLAVINLKQSSTGVFVLIPGVFEFRYLENQSAAFGVDLLSIIQNIFHFTYWSENPLAFLRAKMIFFSVITIAVVILLCVWYRKIPVSKRFRLLNVVVILFIAGALGNLIDRIVNNYVVDFFYFKWIDFPVFNVADIYVTVTMILLLILILFFYKEEDLDFLNRKGKHGRDNRN
jgi:signal peptidase II